MAIVAGSFNSCSKKKEIRLNIQTQREYNIWKSNLKRDYVIQRNEAYRNYLNETSEALFNNEADYEKTEEILLDKLDKKIKKLWETYQTRKEYSYEKYLENIKK